MSVSGFPMSVSGFPIWNRFYLLDTEVLLISHMESVVKSRFYLLVLKKNRRASRARSRFYLLVFIFFQRPNLVFTYSFFPLPVRSDLVFKNEGGPHNILGCPEQ